MLNLIKKISLTNKLLKITEKKDYFVRSCIYNRVCVVGKKETVYQIVEKLQEMQSRMEELAEQIKGEKPEVTTEEIRELQTAYEDMLKAILSWSAIYTPMMKM